MLVPLNTLHQSISIIRRGFKQVQSTDDKIIKNIPGQGFKILSKIDALEIDESLQISSVPNVEVANEETLRDLNKNKYYIKKWKRMLIVSMACFLIAIVALYFLFDREDAEFYRGYKAQLTKGGCHVYSNDRVKYDFDKVMEIQFKLQKADFFCKDYPWLYISTYKASSVSSAIICKKAIKNKIKDNCISFYFRDEIDK